MEKVKNIFLIDDDYYDTVIKSLRDDLIKLYYKHFDNFKDSEIVAMTWRLLKNHRNKTYAFRESVYTELKELAKKHNVSLRFLVMYLILKSMKNEKSL